MDPGLDGASLLVTGGTGSFGRRFVHRVLVETGVRRVVVLSRDELKQFQMASDPDLEPHLPRLRFLLGDVRDAARMHRVMEGVDTVVHAAALKQVPTAERNPMEFIRTNILGAQNVVEAALDSGVRRVVALSTDKAAAPINLYGATKLCSDKLFVAANNIRGRRDLRFSVVRYGNVLGSRGSVIPFFLQRAGTGVLPITDPAMTRFNILLDEGVDLVLWALGSASGGEILVPKIPSYRITDVATAIAPEAEHRVVGIRPGEKLHEEMITTSDSWSTVDLGDHFAILATSDRAHVAGYAERMGGQRVPDGFLYSSGRNDRFLNVEELRDLIRTHVDPAFAPR